MVTDTTTTPPQQNSHRYERKFVLSDFSRFEVERFILRHSSLFREVFHERYVNNIYFDTVQRRHYWDSIYGAAERMKVRIRWYGETFGRITRPVLELKQKNGIVGHKDSYRLGEFSLDKVSDLGQLKEIIHQAPLPDALSGELMSLRPILLNRYRRKYFLSADAQFRITIDDDLHAFRLTPRHNTFRNHRIDRQHIVIEVKYSHASSDVADQITSRFPFRMTRWSKYVNGIGDHYFH